jgi:FkbM family methyltransferase
MLSKEERQAVIDLFPFLNERPVIFDIGSNKGHWADVILEEYGYEAELHLVEPVEKLLSYTQVKYEYHPNIVYHNFLAHSKEGGNHNFFYFENYNNELSSVYDGGDKWDGLPKKSKNCPCRRIDSLYKDFIDFIKIDCEGADMDVLLGCEGLLQEDRVGIIQIEYSEHWQRGKHKFEELKSLTDKYGYKIYRYIVGNFIEVNNNPDHDNLYITKYNIHNYSKGWNNEFIINTSVLPKLNLVLEVGTFEGLTAKYICEHLLEGEDSRVICVDPLEEYYTKEDTEHIEMFKQQYQRFKRNTRGLPIQLIRKPSEKALPELHELRFDFIYIDGHHGEEEVYIDAVNSMPILKGGGHILFDDYQWRESTKAGIDRFLQEYAGQIEIIFQSYQVLIRRL